jgi:hypothetical protein
MKNIALLLLFITFNICLTKAQDKMVLRGKPDTLVIKVIEIGVDEIRYRTWPVDEAMPVMVEKKDRIRRVVLSNGTVLKFAEDEFSNAENYATQRKMAFKIDMFSPIRKVLSGSFEYSIKPGMSAEIGVGVIGVGSYTSEAYSFTESNGGFLRLGVKFINQPDYYVKGMRYSHILKGGYIRPEIMLLYHQNTGVNNSYFGGFGSTSINRITDVKGGAFFMNFGKQWVYSDIFCVDFFIGPGIGTKIINTTIGGNTITDKYSDITEIGGFGFIAATEKNGSTAFCFQTGLKLGVLIGSKGKK